MNRIIEYDVAHHDADLFLMTHTNPLLQVSTVERALERYPEVAQHPLIHLPLRGSDPHTTPGNP